MTDRRHAHTHRPRFDHGAEESAAPACDGRWFIYDVLIDYSGGAVWRDALRTARGICGTCPIAAACLTVNAEEPWAQAVITNRSRHANTAHCGTPAGHRNHLRHGEAPCEPCRAAEEQRSTARRSTRNTDRLADIRDMLDAGAGLDEVCRRIGITPSGLWKWCDNHAPGLWRELTKASDDGVGEITTRRRGKREVAA